VARQRIFAAIMELLADRQWHHVRELSEVTRYPDEWVRELLLEDRIEVSTESTSFAALVRLQPTAAGNGNNGHAFGSSPT
jgi:hypothetical protein